MNGILNGVATSPRLVCHNSAGLAYFLPKAFAQRLVGRPHVQFVAAWSYFGGIYRNPSDQITGFASDPLDIESLFPDWEITPDMAGRFRSMMTASIVSTDLMEKFKWKVGERVMLRSGITALYRQPLTFTIVGAMPKSGPSQLFIFRNDYLEQVNGHVPPVSYFWIRIDRIENAPAVIKDIDDLFHNASYHTQTETESSYLGGLLRQWTAVLYLLEIVSIAALISIALVAANTAAMSMRERRREIAVMRAIGFSSGQILSCLLGECWLLGLLGGAVGCALTYVAIGSISHHLPGSAVNIRLSTPVLIESLIVAGMIGIVSGIVPATFAVRRTITEGLRSF
jgi:putative ABC transport system permease protein